MNLAGQNDLWVCTSLTWHNLDDMNKHLFILMYVGCSDVLGMPWSLGREQRILPVVSMGIKRAARSAFEKSYLQFAF